MGRKIGIERYPVPMIQILRFACVGVAATIVHVVVGLLSMHHFGQAPLMANFYGFGFAFIVSFVGHAKVSFRVKDIFFRHIKRFLALSLISLLASSMITNFVEAFGGRFALSMILVGVIVPSVSFFGAKFWAFADVPTVTDANTLETGALDVS